MQHRNSKEVFSLAIITIPNALKRTVEVKSECVENSLFKLTRMTTLIPSHQCICVLAGWCFLLWDNLGQLLYLYTERAKSTSAFQFCSRFIHSTNEAKVDQMWIGSPPEANVADVQDPLFA